VIVSTSPSALTNLTPTTVELTCPSPDLPSDASLVPQHATEPAVALPISGGTSVEARSVIVPTPVSGSRMCCGE
jgi:hypothetical protein